MNQEDIVMILPYLDQLSKDQERFLKDDVRNLIEKRLIKNFDFRSGKSKLTPKNVAVISKIVSEYDTRS